ncbi:hypothetical protein [Staphylococcus phage vB_SauM-V1SA20]|nr:hypothetical protein [Staphylococcus phage vB_SauM-V1SA20]
MFPELDGLFNKDYSLRSQLPYDFIGSPALIHSYSIKVVILYPFFYELLYVSIKIRLYHSPQKRTLFFST